MKNNKIDPNDLEKQINEKYQKDKELIEKQSNLDSSSMSDLNIDLEVMRKNISTITDKIPLDTRFRWVKGFIKRLIRSVIIVQESFNAATYRVIKILANNYEKLSKKCDSASTIENKIQNLEKKVDELSTLIKKIETEVKSLNQKEHEEHK